MHSKHNTLNTKELRLLLNRIKANEDYDSFKEIAQILDISVNTLYKSSSLNPGTVNIDNVVRKLKRHFPQYFEDDIKGFKEEVITSREGSKESIKDKHINLLTENADLLREKNERILSELKALREEAEKIRIERDQALREIQELKEGRNGND